MSVAEQMKCLRVFTVFIESGGGLRKKSNSENNRLGLGPCSLSHTHPCTLIAYLEFSGGVPVQIF